MTERTHKATLSQSQGREGWSVIFRHPVLLERTTGKPGRRVRRGLGTRDEKVAKRLVAELNELLADKLFWQASSRATALTRFRPLVVDIFYHDLMPEQADAFMMREIAMPLPKSSESAYRQILLLGATGGGKTTLVRQFLGTDPVSERFPATSTARTTVADSEIFFSAGPFRAVVTFLPRDEVRDYLEESMSAAALAAYHGEPDSEVLRRLLDHVDQRFRLSYVLGGAHPEDTDEDELAENSFEDFHEFDLSETRKLLTSSVRRLRQIAHQHIPGLREELVAAESDEIVREERFEDASDNLLRSDDRFQILAADLMGEIERRFESLPGELTKTKQGWPESWFYESADRQTFLKIVSRFTSNYAPRFGTLLTPLVNGIRVAGRFAPNWLEASPDRSRARGSVQEFRFVLLDGEGLGHTPDPAASLPTSVTRRFEDVDAVLLVDNAAQPMQAATVAAMRNLASNGQAGKLIICFTHFDNVGGDNMPTFKLREQHVLASAENALTSIGEELGSFAERALRQRLGAACFFLANLHQTLTADTKTGKRTIEQLRQLPGMIDRIVVKPQPVASRPVYDRMYLVLAMKQAAEEFQTAWKARLGLGGKTGILKQHWRRIKALARRFSEGWSDEYQDLKPLADLHQQLQEAVYRFIQSPAEWTGPVPSDDEKQQVFTEFAGDISTQLLIPAAERVQDEALQMWREAYHLRGENATFRRAILIRSSIFEKIAPLLDRTPDANKFMNDVIRVVRNAAERHSIVLH